MAKYGFLGLGIMGSAMAANLVKGGLEVVVWNRTPDKCLPLVQLGAVAASTPRAVVEECALTFAMLADPAAASAVCFGPEGALEGIASGRDYVDMSTVDAGTAQRIAGAVAARGGRYLEAPVSGTRKPAEDGTLIILAGGDRSLFDDACGPLEMMGSKILYLGEAGTGARMKLVINMIMGGMMTAFCEGLALGEKGGLRPEDILEVLGAGALANPMFKGKGELIRRGEYPTAFPLKHMQKDLRLALALGDELAQPLHCAAAANEAFKRARARGWSEADFSALFEVIRG
ncbi:3-hydroxyisobutyrate dehydrogenase/ beta-hydroxyacid dehydrogenase [Desulfuromonas soudanensis]|uniref:3-hydroxyisobutyrate dehydrogenase/ beta-hydroxyacid dehydrogenase n=1 Tax=Desulfuromonas soudanensis TaxID=1603606 RepID=A0A0M4CYS1_9BACT|nr:NAD(P)-dependent oxidoreductase [Desulfuromonas soudanensis]ALC14996.1 3-hydroxyisobutyrate dehydrogenase/ beta-hydroxyacid dehydrogenase [Desulfuromonas soudanensis]